MDSKETKKWYYVLPVVSIGSVAKTGCAVTAENHSVIGGLGSAVAELLVEKD